MTREERDMLIALKTEFGEFRRATEGTLKEVSDNVTTLVAAHQRQKGATKLLALLWAGLLALGGLVAGIFTGGQHHG